jgi:arylsulfatase
MMGSTHSRRDFLKKSVSSAIAGVLTCSTVRGFAEPHIKKDALLQKPKSSRPNILFIFTDDQGYLDLGCYGHPVLKTPNLDRLAGMGCRLTNFYVTSPVCSPSRAGCLTGLIPNRYDMETVIMPGLPPWSAHVYHHLPVEEPTYARQLQQAGYRTGHVGKWHLGHVQEATEPKPDSYGFDYYCIMNGPRSKSWYKEPHDWIRNGKVIKEKMADWTADLYTDESIRFLETCGDQPFLLNYWTYTPHEPVETADKFKQMYANCTEPEQTYFGAITQQDASLGRLFDYLEKKGLSENTIIIFTSDNGPELMGGVTTADGKESGSWAPNSRGATPFRDRKHDIHEGGIRVPAIIKWPGLTQAGSMSHVPVSTLDFLPTFCLAAGASFPKGVILDGGDFRPALNNRPVERSHALYWQFIFSRSQESQGVSSPPLALRQGHWKLMCELDFTKCKLYNLNIDPVEQFDMSNSQPQIVEKMLSQMREIYADVNCDYPRKRYLNREILYRHDELKHLRKYLNE